MIGANLQGEKELKKAFKKLGPEIMQKVTVGAMHKAAKPIEAAARANAMRLGTRSMKRAENVMAGSLERKVKRIRGHRAKERRAALIQKTTAQWYVRAMEGTLQHQLAHSIGARLKKYTSQGVVFVAIGPKWPEGAHGHLVEYGHQPSGWYARQQGAKYVPATPFMRPAFDAQKRQALQLAIQYHRARIEREAKKARGR